MPELLPPWLEHPQIMAGSIGWRMGYGEDYWMKFMNWYLAQTSAFRADYRDRHPEPDGWAGFYARLRGS